MTVTDTFDLGVRSLAAHARYLEALPGHPDPEEFLEGLARPAGTRLGCRYGAAFEVYPLQLL